MSDNKLKIDVVLADVGESGAVLSDFVTQDLHNTDMAKKADLVNGKVNPTQLPEFSELSGVTDVFSQLEINLRENINTSLTDSKAYADSIVSEVMSKKADLVNGRVPKEQATNFKDIPGAKAAIDGLKQSLGQEIIGINDSLENNFAKLTNGKVSQTVLPTDLVYSDRLTREMDGIRSSLQNTITQVDEELTDLETKTNNKFISKTEAEYFTKDIELKAAIDGLEQKSYTAYASKIVETTKADLTYVDRALGALSTAATKFYPTLALANAVIANLQVNQPVQVGEVANGGLWYKATAVATSLTKSPHDPLVQGKEYVNTRMILNESQGAFELVDVNGRFVIYIKKDGTIVTKHGDLTVVQSFIKQNQSALLKLLTYDLTNSAMLSQLAKNHSKDYLQLTSGDRFVLRILNDASLQVGNLNLTRAINTLRVDVDDLQSQGLQNKWITPNKNLVAVGDSLTAYAHEWFANLNTYLTDKNRTYTNRAVGGDKSAQQALKFGAGNYLLTLENQKINASGSTNITGTFVRYADKSIVPDTMLSSQSSKTIIGSIAGVKGVINATYSGSTLTALTFTPTVAPSADVPVYDYTPFIPASLEVDKFKTFAIAIGRNNLSQPERIKQDILAMIDAQATIEKRFFVVTPPSKTYSVSSKDSAEIMANIFDIERWAMENFGERAIISRQILMRYGDGSATDNLDIANNCVPTSCTEDGLHWTATANTYIAQEVANLINSKGW